MAITSRIAGQVPAGVTFGNTVAVMPDTSNLFVRNDWVQRAIHGPINSHKPYTWITRGDVLATFVFPTPKSTNPLLNFFMGEQFNELHLCSPVSGLLLNPTQKFGDNDSTFARMALLLPDDEHGAENGEYIFSQLCNFCWKHRESIFFIKPPDYIDYNCSGNVLTEARLRAELEEQQSRQCKYLDAVPTYNDYFQEARTRHPELRPFLRHLL